VHSQGKRIIWIRWKACINDLKGKKAKKEWAYRKWRLRMLVKTMRKWKIYCSIHKEKVSS
jgi:hypothetical protein